MKKLGEFIIEIILPIIAVILTITVILLMGGLIYTFSNEMKMRERAEMVFHYNNDDYYIASYEYSEDQIVAIGVNGKEVIFPKNGTVIEDIKGE
jgi:predicted RND superfamily exporter protein